MTSQKRRFDSFIDGYDCDYHYDYNSSTPFVPDYTSSFGAAELNECNRWLVNGVSNWQWADTDCDYTAGAGVAHVSLDEPYAGQNGDNSFVESLEDSSSMLLSSTQQSTESTTDQAHPGLTSNGPMNICYGMIYLSKAKLVGDMQKVMDELSSIKQDVAKSHYLLDVVESAEKLFVVLPSASKAMQLNQQVNEALHSLVSSGQVRLQALIHREIILNKIGEATASKHSELSININVYGSFEMSSTIGRCLSKNKIWLQRPDWLQVGSAYENPHVIRFEQAGRMNADASIHSMDVVSHESSHVPVEDIYSKLSRAAHLKGVAGDARLATPLLPHQEEALEFMLQREQGFISSEFRLWTEEMVNGTTMYRHKITEQRSRSAPNEHGGGILADEMGTGKTLSALALIVATLESADVWAHDRETHLSDNIPGFKTLSQATLVVVPSPLILETWQAELRKHTKTGLDVFVYHGTGRNVDPACLAKHEIVLTTYHTLVSDHARNLDLITQIAWYRIVLDEAHFIRRTSTFLHKRVAELDAKFRWCLTGTPIQNSLDDLGALFAFLNIAPFDRLGIYKKHISGRYAEGFGQMVSTHNNLITLLDAMCIRRTKDQVHLCQPEDALRYIDLSPEERSQYNSMTEDMKRALENITGESDGRRQFGSFQAKLQLRLLCNHGTYEDHFHWAKHGDLLDGYVEGFEDSFADRNTACSICKSVDSMLFSEDESMESSSCVHTLCSVCKEKSSGQCPLCDYSMRVRNIDGLPTSQNSWTSKRLRRDGYSSKMEVLVQDLLDCRNDKSIVFSCWTTTLELVARHLRKCGIQFEQMDGRMSLASRQKTLEAFSSDASIAVLIMTTGVGAVGLNLIAANRVFLVEPQWNPSVESQAIGRTTRIGQAKTVRVTRYVTRGTVEEDFLGLQRRKRGIARMAEKPTNDTAIKAERRR